LFDKGKKAFFSVRMNEFIQEHGWKINSGAPALYRVPKGKCIAFEMILLLQPLQPFQ